VKVLVTGGCGFIGSHFMRHWVREHPADEVVNLDLLTYAGKQENLRGLAPSSYRFVKGSIADQMHVTQLFKTYDFETVINFAAESHVDKSIRGPRIFVESNVTGTLNLLECAYQHWRMKPDWQKRCRYVQISTDEVYGSLPEDEPEKRFSETSLFAPSSPYSASKAAADHLVMAYWRTFGMPALITRCSNNFGPFQDPEKLIPLMIMNAMRGRKLPVYGDGLNVRDWIYVEDHCAAVDLALHKGRPGEAYNIGADSERRNIDLVHLILKLMGKSENLIQFVPDRPGHDRRYAIDSSKARAELGWAPRHTFEDALEKTIAWYQESLCH